VSVTHGPDRPVVHVILISLPWIAADMQVRVRSSRKHHPCSTVANSRRKPTRRSIERPCDHPMRSNRNRRAGLIHGIGVASLRSATQHVDQTRRCVGWLRLALHNVDHPPHTMGFKHIGGAPILFSSPGVQTHSFVPLTRTVMMPPGPSSAIVASLLT
jgi:hypothetical protein